MRIYIYIYIFAYIYIYICAYIYIYNSQFCWRNFCGASNNSDKRGRRGVCSDLGPSCRRASTGS